jgi:hypothetical protein
MASPVDKSVVRDMDIKDPSEQLEAPVGIDDAAPIPKGQIDPVYEAKARVLNRAVCLCVVCHLNEADHRYRFKILEWDGTNGNCSLL